MQLRMELASYRTVRFSLQIDKGLNSLACNKQYEEMHLLIFYFRIKK